MKTFDPYEVLGVDRTATDQEIKDAYRKLAMKHHPDVAKDKAVATEKMKAINRAYDILSDADKRRLFDETGDFGDGPGLKFKAVNGLVSIVMASLEECKFQQYDVLLMARRAIIDRRDDITHKKTETELKAKTFRAHAARFSHKKGGQNLFADACEARAKDADRVVENFNEAMELGDEMLRLLDDFEYRRDDQGIVVSSSYHSQANQLRGLFGGYQGQ